MILQPQKIRLTVVVSSGSGSTNFTINGRIDNVFIKAPSGTPTLGFEITDADGDTVTIKSGITADALIEVDNLCIGQNTLTIRNASADGNYIVKIRWDHGV